MRFLRDSNTFIEAKNRYYRPEFCPAYWDWLLDAHAVGELASIERVGDELRRGHDDLAEWARHHRDFFVDVTDEATQVAYSEVVNHVASAQVGMRSGALAEFLSGADPWLIAKARATGATIVTHERSNSASRRKFLIPNVAASFGVACLDTFDLLGRSGARFVLAA
ncbi:DUF4411 family protein [Sphaerotilus mobilis]|uniref:Uncharacterized protein DUF4411 n=1 Tax=Sphaerotilus mobilis TaxID=47994 RepID=A0A4Q7LGH0_9BURK|nr:DUF4411 family protein [Sphaerotilus mobilis]RZS53151.1 uncharacterized protein DUF4411 [Sphaerotilus mobilis]